MKYLLLSFILVISCSARDRSIPKTNKQFNDYWYQGKAEVSSYKLEQARYGEIRTGYTVMIFVTEDYSKKDHIKINDPATENDVVKILKLNMDKKFNTGIYPYSMMQSTFTPVDINTYQNSLRVTATVQEWCGHTFSMLDHINKNEYQYTLHSYFDGEGDQEKKLHDVFLEDEIWTMIRIDYKKLPTKGIKVIPGLLAQRLSHRPLQIEGAEATLTEGKDEMIYTLDYIGDLERTLNIHFEKEFPHKILSWEETYISGFGANAKKMTTKATLNKTLLTDYWSKNHNSDIYLRKELGIE